MVILRDEARFVLKNKLEMAIPLEVWEVEGDLTVRVWPRLASLARKYQRTYQGELFSDEAIRFLVEGGTPYLNKKGYQIDPMVERREHILFGDGKEHPIPEGIEVLCLRAEIVAKYENLTEYDLSATLAAGVLAYVVIEGGKIVSIAATNEPIFDGIYAVEIGVETAPLYQGKGYATACVIALGNHLTKEEIKTEAHIEYDNPASLAAFERAGYTKAGRVYYLVGERS